MILPNSGVAKKTGGCLGLQQQIWGAVEIRKYSVWLCKGVGRDEQWKIGTYEQMLNLFLKGQGNKDTRWKL